ncbi:MAG: DUF5009 domain-containing protein [Planctomycetota bacterium]
MSDTAPGVSEVAPERHSEKPREKSPRLASLDAYRGFTMLLLAFTVPNWGWQEPIAQANESLRPLLDQFEHAAWRGLTVWDMIQPSFMFMVGVAAPFSYASRKRRGATDRQLWAHAAGRAVALILLGVFLRSLGRDATYWTLEDVVTQIGLSYLPLFWLATQPTRMRLITLAALLMSVWALFALWPVPAEPGSAAVLHFDGFWAHWNQNTGPGHALDLWLLNSLPRSEPFVGHVEGYNTLNFVPSLATMLLGLMAGAQLWSLTAAEGGAAGLGIVGRLIGYGLALLAIGLLLDQLGVCPIVKKLWTPSFVLVSGGLSLWLLALLYAVIDMAGWRSWAWPAEVVGRNPLAMYFMTWAVAGWVLAALQRHLGCDVFQTLGDAYAPLLGNLAVGLVLWMICWWMDRNRAYVRL